MSKRQLELWEYAAFTAGETIGTVSIPISRARLDLWSKVFNQTHTAGAVSQSVLVSAMMEAYLKAAQPRPPGNIHAAQKVRLFGGALFLGDVVEITTSCKEKSERNGRKWISFTSRVASAGKTLLEGEILTIWAR
jgi:hypothetical protein